MRIILALCPAHQEFAQLTLAQTTIEQHGYSIDPVPIENRLSLTPKREHAGQNVHSLSQRSDVSVDQRSKDPDSQRSGQSESSIDSQQHSDDDFLSPRKHRSRTVSDTANKKLTPKIRMHFYGFCEAAGEQDCRTRLPFSKLSLRTKQKKAYMGRRLFEYQIMAIAEDEESEQELREMILKGDFERFWFSHSSQKFNKFISTIVNLYEQTDDKFDKRYLLSLLSTALNFGEVQEIIPGLTEYQFTKAKKTLFIDVEDTAKSTKDRYDHRKINRFIEFITR